MTTLTASAGVVPAIRLTLKDILFTTDFSEGSEHALPCLRSIARAFRSAVHLCHIEHAVPLTGSAHGPEIFEAMAKMTAEHLTALLNSPALKGLNLNLALGSGKFKDELLRIVRERNIDLILAGTHGHAGFKKFLLGSVTEEIMRAAPCAVMIVGPSATTFREVPFRRILFPTSMDGTSEKILPYVILLAREFGSQVIVLHVVANELRGETANGTLRESIQQEMAEALAPALASFKPEFVVETGDAADTVLRVARERKADLIAVGTRNRFAPGAQLRSTTTYRIMAGAQCPVLALR